MMAWSSPTCSGGVLEWRLVRSQSAGCGEWHGLTGMPALSDIYNDRRQNWLKDEVIDRAQQLDDVATK